MEKVLLITELIFVKFNSVENQYYQTSGVLYTFTSNKF